MIEALNELEVATLFVEDLASTEDFCTGVFGLEVVYGMTFRPWSSLVG